MSHWWKSAALAAALIVAGCAGRTSRNEPVEVFPDMDRQPKARFQTAASRAPVPGTVALGFLKEDEPFHTGIEGGLYVGRNPLPIDRKLLARGQQRFNIYCTPCHDRAGTGQGIVATKAFWAATNLNDDRIKRMVDGELFTILTNGKRSMPSYRFQISAEDRWAIVAYVRALQRASAGTVADVPADLRAELR